MTTKGILALAATAAVLGGVAWYERSGVRMRGSRLNGERLVPRFEVADVASVEIGDKVKLAAGADGWTVVTMQDYPADRAKITEGLMKLWDLKVGQVVRGKELAEKTPVTVRDASGRELASVTLGERHAKWGFGRYAAFKDETVLVGDPLDAFGDDPLRWCETKIVDEPYIRFSALADPAISAEELGFATGVVKTVTVAGDTNRTVTVGNAVKGGSDRYLRLDGLKWTFVVPGYSVEKLLPSAPEAEKPGKN